MAPPSRAQRRPKRARARAPAHRDRHVLARADTETGWFHERERERERENSIDPRARGSRPSISSRGRWCVSVYEHGVEGVVVFGVGAQDGDEASATLSRHTGRDLCFVDSSLGTFPVCPVRTLDSSNDSSTVRGSPEHSGSSKSPIPVQPALKIQRNSVVGRSARDSRQAPACAGNKGMIPAGLLVSLSL